MKNNARRTKNSWNQGRPKRPPAVEFSVLRLSARPRGGRCTDCRWRHAALRRRRAFGTIAKTRQNLHSKNSWNWVTILVSATIWLVFNGKCIKTGNGNDVNQLKIAWKNSWNHIKWTYFWRILAIWNHSAAVAASVARSANARRAQQVSSAASEASRIRREADRPKDVTNAASASAQYWRGRAY